MKQDGDGDDGFFFAVVEVAAEASFFDGGDGQKLLRRVEGGGLGTDCGLPIRLGFGEEAQAASLFVEGLFFKVEESFKGSVVEDNFFEF